MRVQPIQEQGVPGLRNLRNKSMMGQTMSNSITLLGRKLKTNIYSTNKSINMLQKSTKLVKSNFIRVGQFNESAKRREESFNKRVGQK